MKLDIEERVLHFKQPAGTSRGVYTTRRIWLITATDEAGRVTGVGECAPLPQLSCDDIPNYAEVLRWFCDEVERTGVIPYEALRPYPSMLFGLESLVPTPNQPSVANGVFAPLGGAAATSVAALKTPVAQGEGGLNTHVLDGIASNANQAPLPSGGFGGGLFIPINGLVWMGTFEEMHQRIEEKLAAGFHCVKLKIGAIDWDREIALIRFIRERYSREQIELRVDANGAFPFDEALYKLELLSQYALHSIEQPIKPGQWANMAELCRESPLPIALDEELIGVNDPEMKSHMLNVIKPRYIILKPSLHGGMMGCREWIETAKQQGIGSWITSALESNIGLNAIAQFASDVYGPHIRMPQGLGTGQLFTDNIPMPLEIRGDMLFFDIRTKET